MSIEPVSPSHLSARTQGAGDLVVCLHSSAGTHAQWQGLAQALSPRWQVLAPDFHGHGRSHHGRARPRAPCRSMPRPSAR